MNYLNKNINQYVSFAFYIQGATDPKKELDKAQFNRMQELLKRKRLAQKEEDVRIT